jgi:hypothetical protein
MVTGMSLAKKTDPKTRMSIYVSADNQRRLSRVPKGEKTTLINDALARALTEMEKQEKFGEFLETVQSIKRVKAAKSSEEMVRELRESGATLPSP